MDNHFSFIVRISKNQRNSILVHFVDWLFHALQTLSNQWLSNYHTSMISSNILSLGSFFGNMKTPTRKIATRMIPTGQFPPGKLPPKKIPTQDKPHLYNSHPGKLPSGVPSTYLINICKFVVSLFVSNRNINTILLLYYEISSTFNPLTC